MSIFSAVSTAWLTQEESERLLKQQADAQRIQNATLATGTEGMRITNNGTVVYPGHYNTVNVPFEHYTRTVDSPGMKASLQELADLWTVRFGDEWVPHQTLLQDEFWHIAVERLHRKGFLEDMRVTSHETITQITVYRLCK